MTELKIKKALGENIFGTAVRRDAGKFVKPGDPNSTSAKMEKVSDLPRQVELRELRARESFLGEIARKLAKKGFRTPKENSLMNQLKSKGTDI